MKKIISIILLISILFGTFAGITIKSSAVTNLSQSQAVEWIKARKAEKWAENYDKSFYTLPQCVDLIAYYFDTLVGWHFGLSAYQYLNRTDLPAGWIYTSKPEPGDIAVWDINGDNRWAGSAGHVALVEAVGSTSFNYVDVNGDTGKAGSGTRNITSPNTYIHPDFKCKTHTWNKGKVTTKATCTSNGVKTYTCTVCGETKTETIKGGHKYATVLTVKATMATNGVVGKQCSVCKAGVKTTIYHPKSVVSNKLKVTYNGKKQYPGVTVKDIKGKVISSKYYTVSYEKNKYVGFGKITVKFKGLYSGTKTAAFMIAPKGTALKAVKGASSTAINVYWNKQTSQTDGYQIQYSTDSKFSKNNKSFAVKNTTVAKKQTGLKSSTKYYFRIRTYKKVNQVPIYSGWSKVISAKTLTPPPTWVKPMYINSNYKVFTEKVGKSYYWIETMEKQTSMIYYFCSSTDGRSYTREDIGADSSPYYNEWTIDDCLVDGKGNAYYVKRYSSGSNNGVYKLSTNGKNEKIFNQKGIYDISGIYGGNIYYLKMIYSSNSSSGVSDIQFCKYNIKTKKSCIIKKKAFNLFKNSDSNGRYMLFEGERNPNGWFAQSVPITLYDAKTNKFYKISNRGTQSVISGGRVYYTDVQRIYTDKTHSKEMTCIISNSLNGKNQKCEAKLSSSYIPCFHICRHCVYFAQNGMSDYYAYIFKSKKFVKVNTDGKYIIEIK